MQWQANSQGYNANAHAQVETCRRCGRLVDIKATASPRCTTGLRAGKAALGMCSTSMDRLCAAALSRDLVTAAKGRHQDDAKPNLPDKLQFDREPPLAGVDASSRGCAYLSAASTEAAIA
jgi:hypothetical protein